VFTVTNTNNDGPGSLRQALADATSDATIQFEPSLAGCDDRARRRHHGQHPLLERRIVRPRSRPRAEPESRSGDDLRQGGAYPIDRTTATDIWVTPASVAQPVKLFWGHK
jgi:hypothetical protein